MAVYPEAPIRRRYFLQSHINYLLYVTFVYILYTWDMLLSDVSGLVEIGPSVQDQPLLYDS